MSKEAMKLALEALEDFEDAIRYDNEQDDIGVRVCCGVLSYNPHTKDCKAMKSITALREALAEQPAQPLTDADYYNACLSYRHDFGLMSDEDRQKLVFEAKEWARAFGITKENT